MIRKHFAAFGNMHFFILLAILWTGISLPFISSGQTTDSLKKVNQLKEVQIREYRLTEQSKSPTPVQILSGNDLKRLNSLSVADAIRYFSGVQLKDYGGIGGLKTINVRSMGSNHTAVFYDGIQFNNAQNGQVDLGKFSIDNLEEISLYSGQKPELLLPARAYASASSIYLKTKTPVFSDGQNRAATFSLKGGSFGVINPVVQYQYKINNNLSASFNTEFLNANGKYKFRYTNGVYDTTAVRSNGDVERFRFQAGLFGKLKNGEWHAQAYTFISEQGLPGAAISNRFDYPQRSWDRNTFVQGSLEQHLNEKISILVSAKYAYDYMRFVDPEYVTINGFLENRFIEQEAYLSLSAKYKLNKILDLALASDYQYQTLNANLYRFAYPTRNTFLNVLSSSLNLKRFNLQANILSTTVSDLVKEYNSGGNKQVFSPTVLFSWQLFEEEQFRLRGFYKDIFRMPTFNDLYYTFIGNTLLKPEYTKQYDLGLTYFKSFKNTRTLFVDIQADAYYNNVRDKIIAQPGANLIRWIMYNIGKVDIRGIELNAKAAFLITPDLILNTGINYTFQKAIDVTDANDDSYRNQIPYIPKNSGSFLTKLDYKDWHLNYSFIYTGFRYNQKANIIYNYMQPWYTHDVAFGYSFKMKKGILNANAEVNNLLNQYYDLIPNFPLPGRNYRFTLSYSI
ncbi:TonB-dependent receptor plug domain-containing protein [Pedobacter nototheniae]|uniref:TonB-dependent receptor plug domain-containing protein n=1 Tax=Pedobacter nototheniae TaxID=2488994 RepID=UPI00103AC4DB|nr:TonB-dependent receptor [Pedobacter nototheniae]